MVRLLFLQTCLSCCQPFCSTGYYRVDYSEDLWKKLAKALKEETFSGIPELNRAQIVDDVMNLARAKEVSYGLALDVIDFIKSDTDYYTWYSAFNNYNFLRRRIPQGDLSNYITVFLLLSFLLIRI